MSSSSPTRPTPADRGVTAAPPLTLAAHLEALATRVQLINDGAAAPVQLRAVPIKPGATKKAYSGFVFIGLQDPRGREAIDAAVPEPLLEEIPWGREAVLTGLFRLRAFMGKIAPEFRVDAVWAVG